MATMKSDFTPLVETVGFKFHDFGPRGQSGGNQHDASRYAVKVSGGLIVLDLLEPVNLNERESLTTIRARIESSDQTGFIIGGERL